MYPAQFDHRLGAPKILTLLVDVQLVTGDPQMGLPTLQWAMDAVMRHTIEEFQRKVKEDDRHPLMRMSRNQRRLLLRNNPELATFVPNSETEPAPAPLTDEDIEKFIQQACDEYRFVGHFEYLLPPPRPAARA